MILLLFVCSLNILIFKVYHNIYYCQEKLFHIVFNTIYLVNIRCLLDSNQVDILNLLFS